MTHDLRVLSGSVGTHEDKDLTGPDRERTIIDGQEVAVGAGEPGDLRHHGVLQQLDRPQHVYEAPSNLLVASLIGSPPMNIVEARLERSESGTLVCVVGEQTIEWSPGVCRQDARLESYVGRSMALGMRPEHFEDAVIDSHGAARLRGFMVLAEPQGAEIVVHVEVPVSQVLIESALDVENDDNGTSGQGFTSGRTKIGRTLSVVLIALQV